MMFYGNLHKGLLTGYHCSRVLADGSALNMPGWSIEVPVDPRLDPRETSLGLLPWWEPAAGVMSSRATCHRPSWKKPWQLSVTEMTFACTVTAGVARPVPAVLVEAELIQS